MVQTSLPLPVGADMIALAILVVAVRGSMVVDEEEEEPAALGAMVGYDVMDSNCWLNDV